MSTTAPLSPSTLDSPDPQRFKALAVVAIAQLMVVLDASVVTVALPSAQAGLHISVANRQWVVTAYTLAFGGLLLLGGRIADFMGRKKMFEISLIGFAGASMLGGLAQNAAMLFGARALQGAFAAIMAPAALSLLTVTFTDAKERARAFGVYGGISGGGAAIGLILGGMLTQFASWRWTLLINVPIALIAAAMSRRVVRESRAEGDIHYDIPGAASVTLGLVALVYGFTKAESDGWGSSTTIAFLLVAVALLIGFVMIERQASHPLLPVRVVLDRNRGGAYLAGLLMGAAMFGSFLFLTYYFQQVLQYSALKTGFAFLPFSAGIIVGATLASNLLTRVGPRALMSGGMAFGALGLLWFTQVGVHTAYASHVLVPELLASFGMGVAFVALTSTALIGVEETDAGVASALVNTTQQVGGSLGTSLLNTIAASATAGYVVGHGTGAAAKAASLVHGYTTAFTVSAALLALCAVSSLVLVKAKRSDLAPVEATPEGQPSLA